MKEKIIQYLKETKGPIDEEALTTSLKLDSKDIKTYNQAIEELKEEGIIVFLKDHRLALASIYEIGILTIRRNHTAYVTIKDTLEKRDIKNHRAMHCLNKDEVYVDNDKVVKVKSHAIKNLTGSILKNKKGYYFKADIDLPAGFKVINLKKFAIEPYLVVAAEITSYEKQEIRINKVLGKTGDYYTTLRSIAYVDGVKMEFPERLETAVYALDGEVNKDIFKGYKDLSDLLTVTIDGNDSRDFDDAISLIKDRNKYRLFVHIADVAHYVKEDSLIDAEAIERGTSVYFPQYVSPMLPERLSNDLCSLNPGELRPTITAEIIFDKDGNRLSYLLYPALIKSKYRLTYDFVNDYLEGEKKKEDLFKMLTNAYELSLLLEEKSEARGTISFEDQEPIFIMNGNKVVDIKKRNTKEAERLIEMFMIEANVAVAETLNKDDIPALYRNHDCPKADKLTNFLNLVSMSGYHFENDDDITPKELEECLAFFKGKKELPAISEMMLRSMAKALYGTKCDGHYALSRSEYCHFTSPIRRYPDLFVHRMLHTYIFKDMEEHANEKKKAEYYADKSNIGEQRAVQAERDVEQYLKCLYMMKHIGDKYEGQISAITSFGFFVRLDNTVEGLIPLKSMTTFFELTEDGGLSDGEISYHIGDIVNIKVKNVDKIKKTIDFSLLKKRRKLVVED